MSKSERRVEPRTETSFLAAELRGKDIKFRRVRDISPGAFRVESEDSSPGEKLVMEFPLPGSTVPIRVEGQVTDRRAGDLGVRIVEVERDRYAQLIALPPPARRAK